MSTILRFEDLEIWILARKNYQKVSEVSLRLKENHEFRFAEQIKAAAGSVMDNIAEGFERNSRLGFVNSLSISKGECCELKSQLYRTIDDKYINQKEFDELYGDVDLEIKKISAFMMYLNQSKVRGLKFKNRP